jgi:hypothetical protein
MTEFSVNLHPQQNQIDLSRPHLSERAPESFSWLIFFFLGAVSIVSSSIVMSVLLQIVWQDSPLFIL